MARVGLELKHIKQMTLRLHKRQVDQKWGRVNSPPSFICYFIKYTVFKDLIKTFKEEGKHKTLMVRHALTAEILKCEKIWFFLLSRKYGV